MRQRTDRTFDFSRIYPLPSTSQRLTKTPISTVDFADDYDTDEGSNVKVSVTAHTAVNAPNVLDLGVGAYNLGENKNGGATLLLQPAAKAISGNGGTSISAPISRAILRKNSGTRVIFRPDSVAIAGAGGTAHAQADLILDYVE